MHETNEPESGESTWKETLLIYLIGVPAYLGVQFGIGWAMRWIGWEWLIVGVIGVVALAFTVRAIRWGVRELCALSGRDAPGLARRSPALEWRIDDVAVTLVEDGGEGRAERIRYEDLVAVYIETTSGGPMVEDFFYVLCDAERSLRVPLSAACEEGLLDRLFELPGFDHGAVILASASVEDQWFVCWERGNWKA